MLLGLCVLAGALMLDRNARFEAWVVHTLEVEARLGDLRTQFERSESARRGYLIRRDARFIEVRNTALADQAQALASVASLTRDNARQQARVTTLRTLLAERSAAQDRTINLVTEGRPAQAVAAYNGEASGQPVTRIRDLTQSMVDEERGLLDLRERQRDEGRRSLWILGVGAVLLLTLLTVGAVVVLRRYTEALAISRDQLRRLNTGLEDAVEARTAELRRANQEIQRFAYIVSHDLRSPLVNVMGFTSEIEASLPALRSLLEAAEPSRVSADARAAVNSELPESIGFIRAATGRMDRLINAILRLSREGRRTLTPASLNMTSVLDGVAASHRARADELGATVTVEWPIPDLVNDRLAMEQVFGNLVDNALKYLRKDVPGRVVVRGRREDLRNIYEVQDNGRGVAPRDHDRIFDLFRRAGAQDQAGEGIGLAHTRALVHRLGGTITVQSDIDQGATFRVSLPVSFSPSQEPAA